MNLALGLMFQFSIDITGNWNFTNVVQKLQHLPSSYFPCAISGTIRIVFSWQFKKPTQWKPTAFIHFIFCWTILFEQISKHTEHTKKKTIEQAKNQLNEHGNRKTTNKNRVKNNKNQQLAFAPQITQTDTHTLSSVHETWININTDILKINL